MNRHSAAVSITSGALAVNRCVEIYRLPVGCIVGEGSDEDRKSFTSDSELVSAQHLQTEETQERKGRYPPVISHAVNDSTRSSVLQQRDRTGFVRTKFRSSYTDLHNDILDLKSRGKKVRFDHFRDGESNPDPSCERAVS